MDRKYYLSQLLPYDPIVKTDDRLEHGFKEYLLILIAAEQAMQALQKGELKQFDPLVGENACQIRAVKLALIALNRKFDAERILKAVKKSKMRVLELLANVHSLNKKKMTLKRFLENERLDVALNYDEYYLIMSFVLTQTKVLRDDNNQRLLTKNNVTESKKIKNLSSVGSLFAKNFVTYLREKMAEVSVAFVKRIANELDLTTTAQEMLSDPYRVLYKLMDKVLHCLPCYWTTEVIMKQAIKSQIPIVMQAQQLAKDQNYEIVRKTTLYFKPKEGKYELTRREVLDFEKPMLVLFGNTCRDLKDLPETPRWEQEMAECGPAELVLAHAAAHRQYPDEEKDILVKDTKCQNYRYYLDKAKQWGCSLENASMFFLAHAYCDTAGNINESF